MYGKVFDQMYDSSLCECWQALVTFQQFIVLSDMQGVVDMTPEAIHRRTNIPLDIIQRGIAELEKDDPRSRSAEANGRRIERLDHHRDWGWRIVNYEYYRNLASAEEKREADRERMRRKRESDSGKIPVKSSTSLPVANGSDGSPTIAKVAHAEAEAEEEAEEQNQERETPPDGGGGPSGPSLTCPHEAIIALYHECLPSLPHVRIWNETRRSYLRARWREDVKRQELEWWKRLFEYVGKSDFLCGRCEPTGERKGAPPFMADLEWIVRPNNFVKIIEGKYENRRAA